MKRPLLDVLLPARDWCPVKWANRNHAQKRPSNIGTGRPTRSSDPITQNRAAKISQGARVVIGLLLAGLILPGMLSAQAVEASTSAELLWRPYGSVVNDDSALNPNNFIKWQNLTNSVMSSFWFDVYFGDFFLLSGSFKFEANNSRAQRLMAASGGENYSTLGDVSMDFEQLYLEWTTPNYWYVGYGKYPLRFGYSKVYSPLNYTARTLDYLDTRGQWNGWFKGNFGPVNFALNYLPSLRLSDEVNERTDAEVFFAGFETALERQTLIASLSGFFFDSLDMSLFFNLQDKEHYEFKEFYMSGGGGISWSILDKLIWRGEFLYGNGYDDLKALQAANGNVPVLPQHEYVERDLNAYYAKALTGFTFSLPGDIEVTAEYFYNGAGMTASQREDFIDALRTSGEALDNANYTEDIKSAHRGFLTDGFDNWKVYELGRHYVFLQILKLGIFQRLDFINTSILLADDLSFVNVTSLDYEFSDNFSIGTELRFFLFKNEGAYSLTPENLRCEISAKYSF